MRSAQNYPGGPSKAGDSIYYIVSRIFPLAALAHVRNLVPGYSDLINIFKGGISYDVGKHRIEILMHDMKARSLAVSIAKVENA